jgi:type I restriction enzyme S subunit
MKKPRWPTVRLGDIAEFRNGMNYNKTNFGTGLKVINVKDFQDRLIADFHDLEEINPDGIVREECLLKDGDILFVRSNGNRDLIGRSMLVRGVREAMSHSAFSIKARFHAQGVLPRFYAYLFRTDLIRSELSNRGGGTNISNLNQDILNGLEVPKPPFPIQRKIASILSAYDDLIENNTRRIASLEAMAQAIYREWFVEFHFPGHEKVKLVDSPLGKIPAGWKITQLKQITTKIGSGATPRGGKEAYKSSGITLIRSLNIYDYHFDHDGLAYIDDDQAAQLDNVVVERRDILLNITGASVARCCMVPSYLLPARVNQHVAIIRVDTEACDPFYVLTTINDERHKRQILALAQGGATREALTKDTISNYEIVLPPFRIVKEYSEVVTALFHQRELFERKNANLRATRDLLLPKLISGELDVEDLDIEIDEAVTMTE